MYLYRDMQTHVDNLFGVSTISLPNGSKGYIHLILSVENASGYIYIYIYIRIYTEGKICSCKHVMYKHPLQRKKQTHVPVHMSIEMYFDGRHPSPSTPSPGPTYTDISPFLAPRHVPPVAGRPCRGHFAMQCATGSIRHSSSPPYPPCSPVTPHPHTSHHTTPHKNKTRYEHPTIHMCAYMQSKRYIQVSL